MENKIKEFAEQIMKEKDTLVAAAVVAGKDPMKIRIVYGPCREKPNTIAIWLEDA